MVSNKESPEHLTFLPAIETLRRCWLERFYLHDGEVKFREDGDLPGIKQRLVSPFDTDARYARKNGLGYKVHLTEMCGDALPHLITHVTTTPVPISDVSQTSAIHTALQGKQLLPAEHIVDSGFVSAELVVEGRKVGVELVGPIKPNNHWQQREGGYDTSMFEVDWEQEKVTCPQGKQSIKWVPKKEPRGGRIVTDAVFSIHDCRPCIKNHLCVRQPGKQARHVSFRPREQYEVLQEVRAQQKTPE